MENSSKFLKKTEKNVEKIIKNSPKNSIKFMNISLGHPTSKNTTLIQQNKTKTLSTETFANPKKLQKIMNFNFSVFTFMNLCTIFSILL
jgi:hypothetical protein